MKDCEEIREWYEEHRGRIEADRIRYARKALESLGYEVTEASAACLTFEYRGHMVRLYPYTGWFCGKSVKDGRGLNRLIKQLRNNDTDKRKDTRKRKNP